MHLRSSSKKPPQSEPGSLLRGSVSPSQQSSVSQLDPISSVQRPSILKRKRSGVGTVRSRNGKKTDTLQPENFVTAASDELAAPVGEHVLQSIGVDWVKEFCSVGAESWNDIPREELVSLFETRKISKQRRRLPRAVSRGQQLPELNPGIMRVQPESSFEQPPPLESRSLLRGSVSSLQQTPEPQINPISMPRQPSKPKKRRDGPSRGPSRALKYKKLRLVQPDKLVIEVPDDLGGPVGEHALQFIGECGDWVKEYCPLNVKNWKKIPKEALASLFAEIKSNYEFAPPHHADKVIHTQCSNLFRHWRERLKSKHFTGKSLEEAESACPKRIDKEQWRWLVYTYWNSSKEKEKSENNRGNACSKKIHSACGAKSISRVVHEMKMDAEPEEPELEAESGAVPSTLSSGERGSDDVPIYIKVWEKTKRHKDGYFDEEGENKMKEFQELHERQIREEGADNLTLDEAFQQVLGHRPGYARGLGKGHRVLDKPEKKTKVEMESVIQRFTERECEMQIEIERLRLDAERKEEEALERERKREEETRAMENRLRAEMECKIQDLVRKLLSK